MLEAKSFNLSVQKMLEFLGLFCTSKCVENPPNQNIYEFFPIKSSKRLTYFCQEESKRSL